MVVVTTTHEDKMKTKGHIYTDFGEDEGLQIYIHRPVHPLLTLGSHVHAF